MCAVHKPCHPYIHVHTAHVCLIKHLCHAFLVAEQFGIFEILEALWTLDAFAEPLIS
jgi:hypothetical protein